MNRLAHEKSPYLQQHAANPVDWYPWGGEVFASARTQNKPIFLSIGYSTCHWCHVMAHESFEDTEVARLMNDAFVCVKVDREERPDLDNIYMAACTMMTGRGGWPLNLILTPDGKPFFAGTYFPRTSFVDRIGMLELPGRIKRVWAARQQEISQAAEEIVAALRHASATAGTGALSVELINKARGQLESNFDWQFGGFGHAPKFPSPHNLLFLLRCWEKSGDSQALRMVEVTLAAMRRGGIFDQLGFGFHRYSTDQQWLLPHFEKMLYDQAMLAMAFIECYQATARPRYRQVAEEIFDYVRRVLIHEGGAFFSAEDADSEGVEGKFYVWTVAQIERLLSPDEAALARRVFNLEADGNFREEAGGGKTGANILYLRRELTGLASEMGMDAEVLRHRLEHIRGLLFNAREQRIHPHKDDKVLTDWNGLMIAALAKGARVFNKPDYLAAAGRAAEFILGPMRAAGGRLLHRFRDGEAAVAGMLDDYAFLIWGLIELYEAGADSRYLQEAEVLADLMAELFWDQQTGGFFQTPADGEQLLLRLKEVHDGAAPSGNSVALGDLLRLAGFTGRSGFAEKARALASAFAAQAAEHPAAHTHLLAGLISSGSGIPDKAFSDTPGRCRG